MRNPFKRPSAAWSRSVRSKSRPVMQAGITAAALAVLAITKVAPGALYIWNGGGANDDWSTAANWTSTAPANDASTDLEFGAAALVSPFRTTANNTVSTFNVNKISFGDLAGVSFILTGQQIELKKDSANNLPSIEQMSSFAHTLAAPLKLGENLTLTGNGTGLLTLGGIISEGKSLTKSGSSTFLLTGNNSYTSGTTISAGTLIAGHANALGTSGTISNSATFAVNAGVTFTRSVTFNAGSTLAGKGVYTPGAAGSTFTVANNVTVAPGIADIATLGIGRNTTFAAGSRLAIQVGAGANNNDRLNVTGTLNTGAANTLELDMAGPDQGKYTLAQGTTLTSGSNLATNGGFGAVSGLNPSYRLSTSASSIELIHKALIAIDLSAPAQMITGGTIPFSGHVANVAPIDSDVLTYTLSGSANVSGLPAGQQNRNPGDASAAEGLLYNGQFTTNMPGSNLVTVTASGTNAATVANTPQNAAFSVFVLDHADASFDAPGDADLDTLDFEFDLSVGQTSSESFALSNRAGDRAGLEFVSVVESGDDDNVVSTGYFTTNVAAFGTLAANASTAQFHVTFDATSLSPGVYQTTYTLNLIDESLPGATAQALNINATATVHSVPEPGAAALSLGLAMLALRRQRRRRM